MAGRSIRGNNGRSQRLKGRLWLGLFDAGTITGRCDGSEAGHHFGPQLNQIQLTEGLLVADFVESYRGAVRPFMKDLPLDDIAPQ
jgi:hypothetical protein